MIALFAAISPRNVASSPQARILTSPLSNKIQQPTITAVLRDGQGLLWIGTQHGIYRFDGSNLAKFGSDQSGRNWIPASYIKRIVETKEGRIFVATFGGGLLTWNSDMQAFETLDKANILDVSYISELAISEDGTVWSGGKEGLFFYDGSIVDQSSHRIIAFPGTRDQGAVSAISADNIGNIYVAFGLELFRISPEKKQATSDKLVSRISERSNRPHNCFSL